MGTSLNVAPKEWADVDVAAYSLAVSLGLMPDGIFAGRAKHVFWTKNPIGNTLVDILNRLVALGILERREEPDYQYRWNSDFRGSWDQ